MDELTAIKNVFTKQMKWRKLLMLTAGVTIAVSSVLFVVFPKNLPGLLMQVFMLLSMASVFGLFFLDRSSYLLTKQFYSQNDILHQYLFKHLKPDDVHKDAELVVELIAKRRKASQEMRSI